MYFNTIKKGIINLFTSKYSSETDIKEKVQIFLLVELNRTYKISNFMTGITSCCVLIICLNFLLDITINILLIFSLTILCALFYVLNKGHFQDVEKFNKAHNLDGIKNDNIFYIIVVIYILLILALTCILLIKINLFPDCLTKMFLDFAIQNLLIESDIILHISFFLFLLLHYAYFSTPRTLNYFLLNHLLTFDDEEYNKPEIEQFKCYSKLKIQHKNSEINLIYSLNIIEQKIYIFLLKVDNSYYICLEQNNYSRLKKL